METEDIKSVECMIKKERIKKLIDEALDNHNKEEFMKLSEEYNKLVYLILILKIKDMTIAISNYSKSFYNEILNLKKEGKYDN